MSHADDVARYLKQVTPGDAAEALRTEAPGNELVVPRGPTPSVLRRPDRARDAAARVLSGKGVAAEDLFSIEAIILPGLRPVVDIQDGRYGAVADPWSSFESEPVRRVLERVLPSIGRIEVFGHPRVPYGGTGFIVGDNLVMTNRHVAEIFVQGLGIRDLQFRSGLGSGVDFLRERDRSDEAHFEVRDVMMVHPYWDMALLRTEGLGGRAPLSLDGRGSASTPGSDIAVIGYPAFDPRNDARVQHQVFGGIYNVKRMAPGKAGSRDRVRSFGRDVDVITHDSSTLGGNSGSCVIDVASGLVVGLHFAGRYLKANYAVAAADLARDPRIVDAGVGINDAPPADHQWLADLWDRADPRIERRGQPSTASLPVGQQLDMQRIHVRVPIDITVEIGEAQREPEVTSIGRDGQRPSQDQSTERRIVPPIDPNYLGREGFNAQFLAHETPLPEITDLESAARTDAGDTVLRYHHFSLVQHKIRRLPIMTAVNFDGRPGKRKPGNRASADYTRRGLAGLGRNDREAWALDPRLPASMQLPERFYNRDRGSFDKGHVVRRVAAAWGHSYEEMRHANADTYHVTNCAPQVGDFNQSRRGGIWGLLEDLAFEAAQDQRLCVFAGPVLHADDPPFDGFDEDGPITVQIPQSFWKVIIAKGNAGLEAFGFVLEQSLADVNFELTLEPEWAVRLKKLETIEALTGLLRFPDIYHSGDQAGTALGEALIRRADCISGLA